MINPEQRKCIRTQESRNKRKGHSQLDWVQRIRRVSASGQTGSTTIILRNARTVNVLGNPQPTESLEWTTDKNDNSASAWWWLKTGARKSSKRAVIAKLRQLISQRIDQLFNGSVIAPNPLIVPWNNKSTENRTLLLTFAASDSDL